MVLGICKNYQIPKSSFGLGPRVSLLVEQCFKNMMSNIIFTNENGYIIHSELLSSLKQYALKHFLNLYSSVSNK